MKANAFFSSFTTARSQQSAKKRVGPSYELAFIKNLPFRKKNGRVHYTPAYSLFPKNVEELVGAMRFAAQRRKRVQFVSQGYSPSHMVPVADVLVYLQDLNRLHIDQKRPDQAILVVETGVTLQQVARLLTASGFNLPLKTNSIHNKAAMSLYESLHSNPKHLQLIKWIEKIDVNGQVRRFEVGADRRRMLREAGQLSDKAGALYRMGLKLK